MTKSQVKRILLGRCQLGTETIIKCWNISLSRESVNSVSILFQLFMGDIYVLKRINPALNWIFHRIIVVQLRSEPFSHVNADHQIYIHINRTPFRLWQFIACPVTYLNAVRVPASSHLLTATTPWVRGRKILRSAPILLLSILTLCHLVRDVSVMGECFSRRTQPLPEYIFCASIRCPLILLHIKESKPSPSSL